MHVFLYPLIAIVVAYLFIPFLAMLKVYTIYEYLEHRFGLDSRLFASSVFLLQRASHIAIAVYAVSLALQQIVGWPVWACVFLVGGLTTLYTVVGGMAAVLWTDVMQFFVLMGGLLVMAAIVLWSLSGDVVGIWRVRVRGRPHEDAHGLSQFLRRKFLARHDRLGHFRRHAGDSGRRLR